MAGCLIGAGSLGCVVPLLLAIYCVVMLNDIGGPLLWPVLVVFGAVAGAVIGSIVGSVVRVVRKRRRL